MKACVCIKQVPPPEARISVSDSSKGVDDSVFSNLRTNPYDEFALEEAVKLREAGVLSEVVVLSIGASNTDKMIRGALAKGGDRAIRIDDASLKGADSLSIARALAGIVKREEATMVFCGKQSIDGDNSQVPAMIAELLNWSQVSVVSHLEVDGEEFVAHREIGGGNKAVISGQVPVVLSCDKGLNKPRHANLKTKMAAKKKKIEVVTTDDLGISADQAGNSFVQHSNWGLPDKNAECTFIDAADVNTAVAELVNLLKKEAKVL